MSGKGQNLGMTDGMLPGVLPAPVAVLPRPVRIVPMPSPPPPMPIRQAPPQRSVRLIVMDNGFGLSRDREVISQALSAAGWTLYSDAGPVEMQIHLEAPAAHLLGEAKPNIIIPNPEWWTPDSTSLLGLPGVRVWAKTKDAERIFRDLGARVEHIGWQSIDRLDSAVPRCRAFLHVAGQARHKGTDALLRAWRPEWPHLTIVAAQRTGTERPNITTRGFISSEELQCLQNEHLFHIYPSRYEGYGHAQWEGLSCGAVVFTTDGPPFDEHAGIFRLLPAVRVGEGPVRWHDVPDSSIAEAVRWALSASEEEIAACQTRSRQGYKDAAQAFQARLRAVLSPTQKQRLTLHSPLPRCGVAEYGRQLDRALAEVGSAMQAAPLLGDAPVDDVGRGDAVLLHFEPGIMPHGIAQRLASARKRGARVVFCCHFFDQGVAARFDDAADVFVVHRTYPFELPKMRVLALGCPVYNPAESRQAVRARLGLPPAAVILTTLGLLSPWKRIPDIVSEILSRRRPEDRVFLQILTPLSGAQAQVDAAAVHRLIEGHPDVLFSTEFRPEKDLLDRVYASDLGVLYHAQDTGSVSAATKQFVSARTPLVITGSSHASDLKGGVVRVDGFDSADLAGAALSLARDEKRRAALRDEAEQEYARLNMNEIARQYAAILQE